MQDEAKLVGQAQSGSEDAFCALVSLHQGRVRTYLSGFVDRSDAVDDLAQEVFLTAHQSLSTFKGDAPLAFWLLGIARHRALRHLRDEARRRAREGGRLRAVLAALEAEQAESAGRDAEAFDREMRALEECLKTLPPESSDLVQQHYFGGRSLVALAGERGRKESAVRVALLRVRHALRRCMNGRISLEGA